MTDPLQEGQALSAAAYLLILVKADAETCAAATLVALCFRTHRQAVHMAPVRTELRKRKRDEDDKVWPRVVKRPRAAKLKACLRCKRRKVRSRRTATEARRSVPRRAPSSVRTAAGTTGWDSSPHWSSTRSTHPARHRRADFLSRNCRRDARTRATPAYRPNRLPPAPSAATSFDEFRCPSASALQLRDVSENIPPQ